MDDFIARQNIRRFEAQLKGECDPVRRSTIERLLDLERQKLGNSVGGNTPPL